MKVILKRLPNIYNSVTRFLNIPMDFIGYWKLEMNQIFNISSTNIKNSDLSNFINNLDNNFFRCNNNLRKNIVYNNSSVCKKNNI